MLFYANSLINPPPYSIPLPSLAKGMVRSDNIMSVASSFVSFLMAQGKSFYPAFHEIGDSNFT
jgi:hypothetical protein